MRQIQKSINIFENVSKIHTSQKPLAFNEIIYAKLQKSHKEISKTCICYD